jgi:hypothetical protein
MVPDVHDDEPAPLQDRGPPWVGPPLTPELVRRAEELLGVRLPRAYVALLHRQNGGVLRNTCHPTDFHTDWAADHFAVDVLLGIGHPWGIEHSADLIAEWDYPEIGVVFGVTPSAGPDTVMLDYSGCGPEGEPAVAYVGDDRVPRRVAGSFEEFLAGLVPSEVYD